MKRFINRQSELNFLNEQYSNPSSSLIVVYGRRRVGKTALISEFIKDKSYLYFLATEESEQQNINTFKNLIAKFTNDNLLMNVTVDNWMILFETLIKYETDKRLIIVIDEFQYLGKINQAFPSIFQKVWDELLQNHNVMVILCGSLIHMMEAQTLTYSSPLYGRRSGQIKLKQITFNHYNEFFADLKYKELIEFYAVTGGVPKYIEMFSKEKDVYDAISRKILDKQSFLFEEPIFLLQNEVSEIGSYFSIIKSIAAGNHKLAKISADLEIKQTGLTKYLKTLINLDILERVVPITENNPEKSKKGLYRIKDNYINFWFKFIYPEKDRLELEDTSYVMNKIKSNFIDNHVSYIYETICMNEMWSIDELNFNKIGGWWNNKTEIDIVAYDSTGNDIIFGECKYTNKPMDIDIFNALLQKKEEVIWKNDTRKEKFILFSISGFSDKLKEIANNRDDLLLFEKY